MKYYIKLAFFLLFFSCQNSKKADVESKENKEVDFSQMMKESPKTTRDPIDPKNIDTIFIDYLKNKKKLEILSILPDSCFDAWSWTKEERKVFENSIKSNGSYIDSTPNYNTIKKVENNYLGTQVVDGYWEMAIFNTNESYIILTNEIVGDGKRFCFYEYKNGSLKDKTNELSKILMPENYIIKQNLPLSCKEKLEEDLSLLFDYELLNLNKIEIDGSWYLEQKDFNNCLKGNFITLTFDKNSKTFKEQIKWQKKKVE